MQLLARLVVGLAERGERGELLSDRMVDDARPARLDAAALPRVQQRLEDAVLHRAERHLVRAAAVVLVRVRVRVRIRVRVRVRVRVRLGLGGTPTPTPTPTPTLTPTPYPYP